MGLGKKDISNDISSKTFLSHRESLELLNSFLSLIKKNKNIKLSKFGSFSLSQTPKRIGRNPKTKEVFEIEARSKLKFKASNKIKSTLN